MPRYHFELADGVRVPDPNGLECENDRDATAKAKIIARRMVAELEKPSQRCLIVVADDGREVSKVPLSLNDVED